MHTDIVGFFQIEAVSFVQHNPVSEFVNRAIPLDLFHSDEQFVHMKNSSAFFLSFDQDPNMASIMVNSIS